MSCSNNLKQIGLALHSYHDAVGTFPSGHTAVQRGTSSAWDYYMPWSVALLPYLEQDNLFKAYDNTVPNTDLRNKGVRETFVKVYTCPSDPNGNKLLVPETGSPDGSNNGVAFMTGSYRGMSGVSWNQGDMWAGFPTEVVPNLTNLPTGKGLFHTDSPDSRTTPERIAGVTDGTSNTVAVGERTTHTHPTRGTFWANGFKLYSLSTAWQYSVTLLDDYDGCIASPAGSKNNNRCKYSWGSPHAGQINFVFADGHVRSLSTSIDMMVFQALSTIGGNEVIPDFWARRSPI